MKTKATLLLFALILSCVPFASASKNFTDVSNIAGYSQEISALAENGIFEGDENGNFRPDDSITRAEFSVVLCRAMGLEDIAKTAEMVNLEYFVDVPATHWAAGYINTAKENGAISGMGNQMFYPEEYVTNEQVIKMLIAAWGYTREANELGGYPNGYMEVAKKFGITDTVAFNFGNASKRWVASMFVYGVLDKLPISDEAEIVHPDWVIRNSVNESKIKEPLSEYTSYVDDPVSILNRVTSENAKYQSLTFEQMVQMSKLPFKIENNKLICLETKENDITFQIGEDIFGNFNSETTEYDLSGLPTGEYLFSTMYKEKAVSDSYICKIIKASENSQPEFQSPIFRYTLLHAQANVTRNVDEITISNEVKSNKSPVDIAAILNDKNELSIRLTYSDILKSDWYFSYDFVQTEPFKEFANKKIDGENTILSPVLINNLIEGAVYNVDIGISYRWGGGNYIKGQLTTTLENGQPNFQFVGEAVDSKIDGYDIVEW